MKGSVIIQALVLGGISLIFIVALAQLAGFQISSSKRTFNKELALQIAEAGVEYYRWHLAHAPTDYQDGTGGPGPYVHNYFDKDGKLVGTFTLTITPPPQGTSIVTVKSKGATIGSAATSRTVQVRLAIPSLVRFAVAANDNLNFLTNTETTGPIHSNRGIRFDGLAHNIVSSARSDYDDPSHGGANEFGVHTHIAPVDPLPPTSTPARLDVFEAGRTFPVPAIDFAGITLTLTQLKNQAKTSGLYFSSSGKEGYHIVLKADDTFDLYKVTKLVAPPSSCKKSGSQKNQKNWGTWSIQTEQFVKNYAFPSNGIVFVGDNVWVDGQVNIARLTIVSGKKKGKKGNITINNDLTYTNYDGRDVVGIIATNNVNVGWASEDDLRIDAVLVAKKGRVGRYYYRPPSGNKNYCGPNHTRTKITNYGMIATNKSYGFAYTDGTGYQNRDVIYDANLQYGPPPGFPLTSSQYIVLSWEEVK